jgi:hypothetical protein
MLSQIMQNDPGGMAYVKFERVAIEDKAASLAAGHYVARDIDMAYITPPYSKDIMKYKVVNWFEQLTTDVRNGRIPNEFLDKYRAAYTAWQQGQELPLDGFPIKGWGVCSPAQQETLIKMHVLTVEQLAAINDEGIFRLGMGGVDLKNKANAWLKAIKKAGPVTIENAALKKQVEDQSLTIANLENKINELSRMITHSSQFQPLQSIAQPLQSSAIVQGISADELLDDD